MTTLAEISEFINAQKNFLMTLVAVQWVQHAPFGRYHPSTAANG